MITATNIQFIISILTLLGIMFAIYKFFRDPDVKAKYEIRQIRETCGMKHDQIDKLIGQNTNDLRLIKENHIAHIEKDINLMQQDMVKVLTILEEREYASKKRD